jgi:hypothetical protein
LAVKKTQLLMFMIISLVSGGLAVLMAIAVGSREFLIISIPGFAVGGFFAIKYMLHGKKETREEEHRKSRRNKH